MVKLARIRTASAPTRPLLAVQLSASDFRSPSVRAHCAALGLPPTASHYVDVSAIAGPSAVAFLSAGAGAAARARALVARATDPGAALGSPFVDKYVVFGDRVARVLSPLDGRAEVGKFLCVGMNYADHCAEQNYPVPTVPLVFSKFGSCVVGPGDPIPRYGPSSAGASVSHGGTTAHLDAEPVVTSKLDYEVELGVVIGTTVPRFTPEAEAHQYIGGYTVVHDVSARDLQLEANGGQWLLGKCGDGYGALGPVIATLDEFAPSDDGKAGAGDLHLECRLTNKDGRVRVVQSSSTAQLVFSTPQIVSYLSKFMTLHPGDVIATGTPPGVGCFRKPEPLWLQDGDVVDCEIEGIGTLSNVVVERMEGHHDGVPATTTAATSAASPAVAPAATPEVIVQGPPSGNNHSSAPQKQRLQNTVCIVTGGARGLGYGIALRLALEGASVVALIDTQQDAVDVAACRLEEEARRILGEDAPASGPIFHGLACDVSDLEQVTSAFRRVADTLSPGRIDVLVQAAGVVGQTNLLTHEVDPDDFAFVMDVNVKGIFHGCRAVLPYMTARGYGRIVNIASIAGKEGNAGMLAYSTSKAAVVGLTKTVGKEYATSGITCNAVAPAVVRTEMVARMPAAQVQYMTDKIPMKRCGTVEEIAALVAYIASAEAGFTTGFCWDATGGRSVY